ncbi:MAG TPA: TIGR00730 family Rossman fold protein [Rhodospirillaceae bacterium]|nr:TIGR00730 family Rossman fold protein [Rhodospirillaceae bacterium]
MQEHFRQAHSENAPSDRWIKTVATYGGSRPGNHPIFMEAARELGTELGKNNFDIVYGGGKTGIMSCIAESAYKAGALVTAVIPEFFVNGGHSTDYAQRVIIVPNMHIRKQLFIALSQASIYAPGGSGTIDEIGDVGVSNDVMPYENPEGVLMPEIFLNMLKPSGKKFYSPLQEWFYDSAVGCGFAAEERIALKSFVDDVPGVIARLEMLNQQPPLIAKGLQSKHPEVQINGLPVLATSKAADGQTQQIFRYYPDKHTRKIFQEKYAHLPAFEKIINQEPAQLPLDFRAG